LTKENREWCVSTVQSQPVPTISFSVDIKLCIYSVSQKNPP